MGCSPWGHKESDTTERLLMHKTDVYILETTSVSKSQYISIIPQFSCAPLQSLSTAIPRKPCSIFFVVVFNLMN